MKRIFITYGDGGYEAAKKKLLRQVECIGEFDEAIAFDRSGLSPELLASEIIDVPRGGGLWSWKPDVILSTMSKYNVGDIIVYCDAGCTLYPSPEWKRYWRKLESCDIVAQRIYQRTDRWTRKELLEYFSDNGAKWHKGCQYQASVVILKITEFTRKLIGEWRDLLLFHPELVYDVTAEERPEQHRGFIENRHDQAVFSALIYKYLANPETRGKICSRWEHIEDCDPFCRQAIRATRLRNGEDETGPRKLLAMVKRVIKDLTYRPFHAILHKINRDYVG